MSGTILKTKFVTIYGLNHIKGCMSFIRTIRAVLFAFLLSFVATRAVMPPEIYAERSQLSEIKAIATVVEVETLYMGESYSEKRMITSMTSWTPELEEASRKTPETLRYGIGTVSVDDTLFVQPIQSQFGGKNPLPDALVRGGLLHLENRDTDMHGFENEDRRGLLLIALHDNDLDEVSRLLRSGIDVNHPLSTTGQTLLMAAETASMANLLLSNGANPKAVDADEGTVLHYAVSREKALELIPLFVAQGVDPNGRGWGNTTPLLAVMDYFNEHRALYSPPVSTEATEFDGVDNRFPGPRDVLQMLMNAGADLNAVDPYGDTALINAAMNGNRELVSILLDLGADRTIKNAVGDTAQDIANKLGYTDMYRMLE
ncbi:MAG: ankyrin repeat domain-containing protein [Spartobacteria bacterium]|nr:ankyrin repeat domain-containing protein [Spartobacteria bacterium]